VSGSSGRRPEEGTITYRDAGVDLRAAEELTGRLAELVETTRTASTEGTFGSFGGRFRLPEASELVASADGVGTKVLIAARTGVHDTVGEDLVNHCVNDILVEGAEPLFFLDYFACGKLDAQVAFEVIEGVARGCRSNGCALLGGETAEMPGVYDPGHYDLARYCSSAWTSNPGMRIRGCLRRRWDRRSCACTGRISSRCGRFWKRVRFGHWLT
jgi:phosphoribosylformylglycinamidine cyclo-ligase